MQIELRNYQTECVQKTIAAYEENHKGRELLVLPTGAGKTVIFCQVIQLLSERHGINTLIVAHRDELLDQAADKYRMVKPDAIIGKVGSGLHQYGGEVTVASIATIQRPEHIKRLKAIGYGLIIIDEAHHVAAAGYQTVLEALPDAFVLMVTATEDRLDGKKIIEKPPLYSASIIDMVQQGYLCDLKAVAIKTHVSLDGLHSEMGDYKVAELENAIDTNERNMRVVDAYKEHAEGRRSICFGVTVQHAHNLAEAFNSAGVAAGIVSGETPLDERKKLYAGLHDGSIKVLTNVQVLTEGFDEPLVSCIIMARPTQSRSLYVQCLDAATQILTPNGWKSHTEVQEGDLVAGYDKETEEIRWVTAISKVERSLAPNEQMFTLQSPTLDIRVTGGHRMLFRARRRSKYAYTTYGLPQWRFAEAQELYQKKSEYELPIAGQQHAPGVLLTDDELRFIGWFLTDGTLNRITQAITIYQAAHQPHHEAIQNCLKGCGFKYSTKEETPVFQYNVTSNRIRYTVSKGQPRGTDKHLTGWGKLEPYIDKNLSPALENISADQLEVLLEAIHLGDGVKYNGQPWTRRSYHIITGNLVFAERLQSLCIRRGFKCNMATMQRDKNPAYQLHIKKKAVDHVGGLLYTDRPHLELSPSTTGELVWCVENELSTLVTRRNGKVAIVGNCLGRGLRLAPAKQNCILLDITDNCLKHRLEPQSLKKVIGKDIKDEETLTEAIEREEKENEERELRVRKLKDRRQQDIQVNVLEKLNWELKDNGMFVLEVGPQKHRIAIVPSQIEDDTDMWGNPGYYSVWARLAPFYDAQMWLQSAPLDWAQQFAEKKARMLLSDANNVKLVDKNAAWRAYPATDKQIDMLTRFGIPFGPTITKGEAADKLDPIFEQLKEKKAKREKKELVG